MPIDNTLFGAWKVAKLRSPVATGSSMIAFIAERVTEEASQDVNVETFIQGTALPRVLNISGAEANLTVVSPLLVFDKARTTEEDIHDGLYLWKTLFNAEMISGSYKRDPGIIMTGGSFTINADSGASYTMEFQGDANALKSEDDSVDAWFELESWTGNTPPASAPLSDDEGPFRKATFYDFYAKIGEIEGYLESLTISLSITPDKFKYIGAPDQRQVFGISNVQITFDGSIIHDKREPTGDDFGWQYLDDVSTKDGRGVAISVSSGMEVLLRQGDDSPNDGMNVLPGIIDDGGLFEDVVFSGSSLEVGSGLLKTTFNGTVWVNSNTLFGGSSGGG